MLFSEHGIYYTEKGNNIKTEWHAQRGRIKIAIIISKLETVVGVHKLVWKDPFGN